MEEINFSYAVEFTLRAEGLISNDPKDTGGATILGVSSKWYPYTFKVLKQLLDKGKVNEAIQTSIDFYRVEFWEGANCNNLADDSFSSLAIVTFDAAVNCGIANSRRFIKNGDWRYALLNRVIYNTKCKTEETHLRGWTRRCARLYKYIEALEELRFKGGE